MSELQAEPTCFYVALTQADNKCTNCGSDDNVSAKLVVPEEAGGQKVPGNCAVLCRTCRWGAERETKTPRFPTSFFVSAALYERLNTYCHKHKTTKAALARFLIHYYVGLHENMQDIWNFQEEQRDVKITVQVDSGIYNEFKELLQNDRRNIQDAMVAIFSNWLTAYGE